MAGVFVAVMLTLAVPSVASADGPVTSLRPWASGNTYYVTEDLDGRAQPTMEPRTVVDYLRAGQWVAIECQTRGEEAYGSTIWDRVGGLYVPDRYIRTYTTGFLEGAPRCNTAPTPTAPTPTAPTPTAPTPTAPLPTAPTAVGPDDRDGDGVSPPADCRDTNSSVHPGAREIPGNGLDDDCAGGDRPGKILALVVADWKLKDSRPRLVRLRVEDAPPSARIAILCRGKCRFRQRHTQADATGRSTLLHLVPRRVHPRSTLEVRITAPNMIGKVRRYRVRHGLIPRGLTLCLPPGANKPTSC